MSRHEARVDGHKPPGARVAPTHHMARRQTCRILLAHGSPCGFSLSRLCTQAEMGRSKDPQLVKALRMAANGMEWQQAYLANPGCGPWANLRRAAQAQQKAADAEEERDPEPRCVTCATCAACATSAACVSSAACVPSAAGASCAAGAPCMAYAAPPVRSSLGLEPCEGRRGVGIFVSRASCLARNAVACIDARCRAVRPRRRPGVHTDYGV